MGRRIPIFYSALLLTGVNLLLRAVGTSFQVYISRRIGAAGVGLLQLVMSVGSLCMIAGIGGVRTATMYLSAEELGRRRPEHIGSVLSGCFLYSILCSGAVGALLYAFAPQIAAGWIGEVQTVSALRLFAAFLPVVCLCNVLTGYFTAANRIGMLAAVEVVEQICAMAVTISLLVLWAGTDRVRVCQAMILGSSIGACLTLGCLVALHLRENTGTAVSIPIRSRLLQAAVPLAAADIVKAGISTTENLMVPRRLARNLKIQNPLAAFGIVSGMVFPVMMFPACILFGLAELLIPELARCAAAGSRKRIGYLVRKSLRASMLYGLAIGGILWLCGDALCMRLYGNPEAGIYLRLYALLVPMLYCDAITDAMTKGLGQQKICVRYNIFTSALDVCFLYVLLPRFGLPGYYASFLVTHLLNFLLSIRRLLRISGERIPAYLPLGAVGAAVVSAWASSYAVGPIVRAAVYLPMLGSVLFLLGIVGREDLHWFRNLLRGNRQDPYAA